jgi:hypothetical protein
METAAQIQRWWEDRGWVFIDLPYTPAKELFTLLEAITNISPREGICETTSNALEVSVKN